MRYSAALLLVVVSTIGCRHDFLPRKQPAISLRRVPPYPYQARVNIITPRMSEASYSIRKGNFTIWTVVPDLWNRFFGRYLRKELGKRGVTPGSVNKTIVVRVYHIGYKQLPFYRRRASALFHVWSHDRRLNLGFARSSTSGSMNKAFRGMIRNAVVYLLNNRLFVAYLFSREAPGAM